jgi:4-oxalomesaconate hydratase
MSSKRLLVVGAHSADFVWRAAGTIAVTTSRGGNARVIALSYGERGESGELWKEPDQTVENVKRIRQEEANAAAEAVGADFQCLDLGDYPLRMSDDAIEQLIAVFQDFQPTILLTHNPVDPFNPEGPAPVDGGRCGQRLQPHPPA